MAVFPPSPVSSSSSVVRRGREQFIPLPRGELIEMFVAELSGSAADRSRVERFCQLLAAVVHREFQTVCETLKQAYVPFDPDSDTQSLRPCDPAQEQRAYEEICGQLQELLRQANFRRLSPQDMDAALAGLNEWGVNLRVDFGCFERLEVFARGDVHTSRQRRRWRRILRGEAVDVPVYQRLAVVFRLRAASRADSPLGSAHPLYIKLFKDIPQSDIETLLPGARVQMTWFDRSRILVPTLSGLAIALTKFFQGAVALVFAGVYGLLAFLGLVGGTLGYGVRAFFGFLQTKNKYQLHLTRHLYFQNLDNNRGAILRLVDEAEEQEFREVLLAYFLLWRDAPPSGWTPAELDKAAEAWLGEHLGTQVDFEIPDALQKLAELRLTTRVDDERWRAAPLDDAYRQLTHEWRITFDRPAGEEHRPNFRSPTPPPPHGDFPRSDFA